MDGCLDLVGSTRQHGAAAAKKQNNLHENKDRRVSNISIPSLFTLPPSPWPNDGSRGSNFLGRVSRAWRRVHVFASSSDWFIGLSVSVVIGQSDYLGFGFRFTTLKVKTALQQSNCILQHGH